MSTETTPGAADRPRQPAKARIVSQATIVFTLIEDEHGRTMEVSSFGSPDMESGDAEGFADECGRFVLVAIEAAERMGAEAGPVAANHHRGEC